MSSSHPTPWACCGIKAIDAHGCDVGVFDFETCRDIVDAVNEGAQARRNAMSIGLPCPRCGGRPRSGSVHVFDDFLVHSFGCSCGNDVSVAVPRNRGEAPHDSFGRFKRPIIDIWNSEVESGHIGWSGWAWETWVLDGLKESESLHKALDGMELRNWPEGKRSRPEVQNGMDEDEEDGK